MKTPIWNFLIPGLGAIVPALVMYHVVEDPLAAAVAGGLGAIAGSLFKDRHELDFLRSGPGASGKTAASERALQTSDRDRADSTIGDLPRGFGRLLLERLPLGVVLISGAGAVLFMNPNARALFGRGADSGFPVEALRAPRLLDAIDSVLRSRAPAEIEFTLSRAKTTHLCAHVVSIAPESVAGIAGDAPAVLVAIEDRTQARRAEELHRDFVANASHELKTPLAAVSGIIETLQGHAKGDAQAEERFLAIMATQTERMKRLVKDLLSLNRIELNERVHPDAPQLVRRIAWEVAETLRPLAEAEGMTITCDAPDDSVMVPGEREELIQVFMNLIENAIKYARPGREIRVVALSGTAERAGMIGIAVEDDGPGIAREHLPRLTERFYRVSPSSSRARGGTGLGLAIVKHIIYRHRGRLEIESKIGEGSRFVVWLPLHSGAAKTPETATAVSQGAA